MKSKIYKILLIANNGMSKNFLLAFCLLLCATARAQFLCPTIGHSTNPNSLVSDSFWVNNFNGNPSSVVFEWRFCDGNAEYGTAVGYPLTGGGVVLNDCEVCLTVFDSIANTLLCVVCDTFNSTGNPGNSCAAYATYTQVDSLYTFFVSTIGNPIAYQWTLNGNPIDTTPTITVVIDSANNVMNGGALVCVTVADANGCASSSCVSIIDSSTTPGGGNTTCQAYFVIYAPDTTNGGINTPGGGLPGHYWGYNLSSGNYGNDLLWDFGDGTTSTDPYPVHTYANPGTYIVCLTVGVSGTSCYDTYCDSSFTVFKTESEPMTHLTILGPTGISETAQQSTIKVYPNPATNELNWTADNHIEQVRIFDVTGQKIIEIPINGNRMNTSKLSSGVYLLQLSNHTGRVISSQRFIKE